MKLRIPSGIGDVIYSFSIVQALKPAELVTPYPELFRHLNFTPKFTTDRNDVARRIYYDGKENMFKGLCRSGGVGELKFRFYWERSDEENRLAAEIADKVRNEGKKLCVIKEPSAPHRYKKIGQFGNAPSVEYVQRWIDANRDKFFFVSVGKDEVLRGEISGIDLDLKDKLSVTELLALCKDADCIASQESHLFPIACAFRKPLKFFYERRDEEIQLQRLVPAGEAMTFIA